MTKYTPSFVILLNSKITEAVAILVVYVVAVILEYVITPVCQELLFKDPAVSYTHRSNVKISEWLLLVLSIILPSVVYFVLLLASYRLPSLLAYCSMTWSFTLILLQSLSIQALHVNFLKMLCGQYRPDFLARLSRVHSSPLANWQETCSFRQASVNSGRQSFPSGHSSAMFCGMTTFSAALLFFMRRFLYQGSNRERRLAAQMEPLRDLLMQRTIGNPKRCSCTTYRPVSVNLNCEAHPTSVIIWVLSVTPMLLASYVSSTRISDHWHTSTDVLGGMFIGVTLALIISSPRLVAQHAALEDSDTLPKNENHLGFYIEEYPNEPQSHSKKPETEKMVLEYETRPITTSIPDAIVSKSQNLADNPGRTRRISSRRSIHSTSNLDDLP